MKRLGLIIFKYVDVSFYINSYHDVRNSKIDPKFHYKKYGRFEGRFPNIYSLLAEKNNFFFLLTNLILIILYKIYIYTNIICISNFIQRCIVKLEFLKIKDLNINCLLISPWVSGGVQEASKLYLNKLSLNSSVGILIGLQHFNGKVFCPMKFQLWKNSEMQLNFNLIFPIQTFLFFLKKKKYKSNIVIHHNFGIEYNIQHLLKNSPKDVKIYYLIHDYYMFTNKLHLFDENLGRISLEEARLTFPNNLVDLNLVKSAVEYFICPSLNLYQKVFNILPKNKIKILYHPEQNDLEFNSVNLVHQQNTFNVLVIGNLGTYKGSKILIDLLKNIERNNLSYKIIHFGHKINFSNSIYYENYSSLNREQVLIKAKNLKLDFAFLPFQSEETYSFVLSDIFLLNLPLITTLIGAISERCEGRPRTILIDPEINIENLLNNFKKIVQLNSENFEPIKSEQILKLRSRKLEDYTFLCS